MDTLTNRAGRPRPYSRGIVVLIILFALTAYAAPNMDDYDWGDMDGVKSDGKSLGSDLKGFSSPNKFQDELQNPLMGGGEMTTIDGETSFDALLQCPSNKAAVVIRPLSFSAGGEVTLTAEFDTNLDGIMDRSFTTQNISGFCVNGFMSCTAGTTKNCAFYEFVPTNGYVNAVKSTMERVGRCDCTNSSCGKSFNSTFSQSLGRFGGAIANHLTQSVGLAVSKSNLDTTSLSVSYMAMTTENCAVGAGTEIAKVKSGYEMGVQDYTSELTAQQQDKDSLYSILTADTSIEEMKCQIINSVTTDGASISVYERQNTCKVGSSCNITEELVCEAVCPVDSLYNPQTLECELQRNTPCPAGMTLAYTDTKLGITPTDDIKKAYFCAKQIGTQAYNNGVVTNANYTETFNLPATVTQNGTTWDDFNIVTSMMRTEDGGDRRTCFYGYVPKWVVNGCSNCNDGGCTYYDCDVTTRQELMTTTINGVLLGREKYEHNTHTYDEMYRSTPYQVVDGDNTVVVQHHFTQCGVGSGGTADHSLIVWLTSEVSICPNEWTLNGQNICVQRAKDISTLDCTESDRANSYCSELNSAIVCGDGTRFSAVSSTNNYSTTSGQGRYTIKRTYSCDSSKQAFDYSELQRDRENITVTEGAGGQYDVNYSGGKIGLLALEELDCAPACKVMPKAPTDGTQVTPDGAVVRTEEGFEYRQCVENLCPISAGEVVMQDCKCDDNSDFGKAVSIIGVMEELGNILCGK